MRRLGLVVLLVTVLAPAAAAKTIRVSWNEQKTLESGGALKFRVTRVVVTPTSWAVTATVTNASEAPVAVDWNATPLRFDPGYPVWKHGFALIHSRRSSGKFGFAVHYEWLEAPAKFARPALPTTLGKGESWTGTFGGSAKLTKGVQYRIGFGEFTPRDLDAGGQSVYWITDHSVTL